LYSSIQVATPTRACPFDGEVLHAAAQLELPAQPELYRGVPGLDDGSAWLDGGIHADGLQCARAGMNIRLDAKIRREVLEHADNLVPDLDRLGQLIDQTSNTDRERLRTARATMGR
jgi:hypothetical protein